MFQDKQINKACSSGSPSTLLALDYRSHAKENARAGAESRQTIFS
jgi:hypothetical protein